MTDKRQKNIEGTEGIRLNEVFARLELQDRENATDDIPPKDTKPQDTKPQDTKPQDTKPQDTKPQDTKPQESVQVEPMSGDSGSENMPLDDIESEETRSGKNSGQNHPPRRKGSGVIGLIAFLFSLLAVGLGGYAAFTQYQLQRAGEDKTAVLADTLEQLQQRLQQGENRFTATGDQFNTALEEQSRRVEAVESALVAVDEKVSASLTTTGRDWLLAEVEYLIRMANQRILMDHDPAGAEALLLSSDRILSDAEDLTAHGLREAIALDVAGLRAAGNLDIEGIYLRINAQIAMVGNLVHPEPRFTPEVSTETTTVETSDVSLITRLTGTMVRFGEALSNLVDFRRNTPKIIPILVPEEEYYLRQNLILNLQMAQLALLEEKKEVYRSSIASSIDWLNKYYDPDHATTIAMGQALEDLAKVDVVRDLPDVSRSLLEVRQLLAEFHNRDAAGQTGTGQ